MIHASIVDYLNKAAPRGMVWHHSLNEGKRGFLAQRWLRASGAQKGWPDLEVFYNGRALFMEVKSAKGPVRPDQDAMLRRLTDAGFQCEVVRSLEDAQRVLAEFAKYARAA